MKLIGVPVSPFVRKTAVVLAAKGVDYETEIVLPGMQPPEFIEISPLNKIPVLQDGDVTLPDSSIICEYLDEKYPEPPMRPGDLVARAQARFLEEYADTALISAMSVPFLENFVAPRMRQTEPDQERVREAVQELIPPALDYVETRVPEQGFLFDHFCIADIALVTHTVNAELGDYRVDPARWPRFAAYIDRVKAHPPVQATLEREAEVLAQVFGGA